MVVQLAVDHLLRRGDDGLGDLWVKLAESQVGFGGGALDDPQGADHRLGLFLPADLEIAQGALGLGAPVAGRIHLDRAEGVGFGAGGGHAFRLRRLGWAAV